MRYLLEKQIIMEIKKSSQKGKFALAGGILAGFAVLALIFRAIDESKTDSDIMIWIAIIASMISVFLASSAPSKTESCKVDSTEVK
jgi:uncharacterized membrane protein YcjF (UPF0283 family)